VASSSSSLRAIVPRLTTGSIRLTMERAHVNITHRAIEPTLPVTPRAKSGSTGPIVLSTSG
jgi:hypothetical protein